MDILIEFSWEPDIVSTSAEAKWDVSEDLLSLADLVPLHTRKFVVALKL
jgi:hypothetical protein